MEGLFSRGSPCRGTHIPLQGGGRATCHRYSYTVTPKEILGQTDIQSKIYCSKIYCMWLQASRDTLDPDACLQEYNCKTHAGGVDVGSCYLQVIIVGWG